MNQVVDNPSVVPELEGSVPEEVASKAESALRTKAIKSSRDLGTVDGKAHSNILAQLDQFHLNDELKSCGEFPRYCPVRINGVHTFAFMDSGNCLPNVISEDFSSRLGFQRKDLKPIPKLQRVGTAKASSHLTVLGTTPSALKLRLGGSQRKISFRPLVIENLAMDVNLSGPFMRRARIDQLHSEGVLCVEGLKIPVLTRKECNKGLLASIDPDNANHATKSDTYVAKTIAIPARSACYVPLRISSLDQLAMSPTAGMVEVELGFANRTGTYPLQLTITQPDDNGNAWTSIWNPTDVEKVIPEDLKFGTYDNSLNGYVFSMWNDPMEQDGPEGTLEDPTDPAVVKRKETDAKVRLEKLTRSQVERTIKEFQLDKSSCLKKDPKLKLQVVQLLVEFDDIMGRGDRIGRTTLVEHDIDTGDLPPVIMKARPLNPVQEEDLKKQLAKWLKQGIIKEGTSEWRFPMVPALKKGTDLLRWATDLRYINKATKADSFQMPDMSDNLARLARSRVFSALDCSGAFLNVPLTPRASERCCFGTPLGNFVFLFMPFGLKNAPATFSRLMQKVFDGISSDEALVFLDDALAHSQDAKQHLSILRKIFTRYRYAGLTLQPRKTHLFRDEVDYLGYHVSRAGLSVVPEYVDVVKNWPVPTTAKEIQIFLGKTGYYRRFIHKYSDLSGPLSEYLKEAHAKGNYQEPLTLSPRARDCFEQLKKQLYEAPILAFPDFRSPSPFILDTDFSGKSIGGVLSQVQDGKERVIAYGAKKLLPREEHYSSNKGELLAVIHFIEKFKYFLSHRRFILRTDHQALKWLATMKCPSGMYARWQELLAHYDFEVKFRKGEHHGNADSLSRIDHAPGGDLETAPLGSLQVLPSDRITAQELAKLQRNDPDLHDVISWVENRTRPSPEQERHLGPVQKAYCRIFPLLKTTPMGVLFFQDPNTASSRICLPETIQERVIQLAHEVGHQGMGSTFHQVRNRFYFWNMAKKVELLIKSCLACQKKVGKGKDQHHTYKDTQTGYPGRKWAIDLVGPLEETEEGYRYILTAKDSFTRWIEAIPLVETSAETIAGELEKEVFSRHGIPEQVHSDNAHNISGVVIQDICRQLGIRKSVTPDYNPKSNPVERAHRDLGSALRAVIEETNQGWLDCLPAVLLSMRTTQCRSTGFTPFFLTYGREARLPVDLMVGKVDDHKMGPVQYANDLYQRLGSAFRVARQQQGAVLEKTRSYYNDPVLTEAFEDGKLVWLYTPRTRKGESKKLHSSWSGPWIVLSKVSEVLRRIRTEGSWNRRTLEVVVSIDRMKPYRSHGLPSSLVVKDDLTWQDVAVDDEEIDNGQLRRDREEGVVVQPQIHVNLPQQAEDLVELRNPNPTGEQSSNSSPATLEYQRQPPHNPGVVQDSPDEFAPSAPEDFVSETEPMQSTDEPQEGRQESSEAPSEDEPEMPMAPTLPKKKNPLVPASVNVPIKRDRVYDSSTDSTSLTTSSEEEQHLRRSERIKQKRLRKQLLQLAQQSTSTSYHPREKPKKKRSKLFPSTNSSCSSIMLHDIPLIVSIIENLLYDSD